MPALFNIGPSYSNDVVSIMEIISKEFSSRKINPDSNVYKRTVWYLNKIYDGSFVNLDFNLDNVTQFDMSNWKERIIYCKGNWNLVKDLVSSVIGNINKARLPQYLPFNKKFIESIKVSNLFEQHLIYDREGRIDCNFIKFINEPKTMSKYVSESSLPKLKSSCIPLIYSKADEFCNKYFTDINEKIWFWRDMVDFSRWLQLFEKSYPKIYHEFLLCCKDSNPFSDLSNYIVTQLKAFRGDNFSFSGYEFKLSVKDGTKLYGKFKEWLVSGISSKKFSILKELPVPIDDLYTDESFENNVEEIKEKPKVDIDEIIF